MSNNLREIWYMKNK